MKREDMEQLISLESEIKAIEASMKSPKSRYVPVCYKDYRTGKGINKVSFEDDGGAEELRELKRKLSARKSKLRRKLREAEDFIGGIKSSQMRTILRMYYINGNTQQEIGEELHYAQSVISSKLKMFWAEQEEIERRKKAKHKSDKRDK